jgi:hypothetical protein
MKAPTGDPAEPDLAWKGYSSAALLPSFLVCVVATLLLLTGGWFFEDIRGLGQEVGSLVFFGLTAVIWIVQALRSLYLGATYVYRLTPRHLFIDRGFLNRPVPPVELASVAEVVWGHGWLGGFIDVGWVLVRRGDGAEEWLTGIKHPAAFAAQVRQQLKAAQGTDEPSEK